MARGAARPLPSWLGIAWALGCAFGAAQVHAQPAPPAEPERGEPPPVETAPSAPPEPAPPEPGPATPPEPAPAAEIPAGVGGPPPAAPAPAPPPCSPELTEIAYVLERVDVRGTRRTSRTAVASYVPVEVGGPLDVDDPQIEALRYRLLGTGWFDDVQIRLERGSKPGLVVLVIEVRERNTLVIQKLAAGVGWSVSNVGDASRRANREAQPYLGASLADLNFLGTGRELGLEFLISRHQQGLALEYLDPLFKAPRWSLFARTLFTNGQEYFGGDDVLATVNCDPERLDPEFLADCEAQPPAAVVDYWRTGWHFGGRRDVGMFTHVSVGYRGDVVRVPPGQMPAAASTQRGRGDMPLSREPIDFAIQPGNSYASMATFGLTFDKRDSTATPTQGTVTTLAGDFASRLIGSDYEFVRMQLSYHRWKSLPWGHVLRGGVYAGSVFGDAPFFYKFFVSDLTDLEPSRILGLNLDHRPAPNIFGVMQSGRAFDDSSGTAISQMRIEDLAGRVDAEYIWPFKRNGAGFLKSGDVFVLLGLYLLADPNDLRHGVPGYEGLARVPVDLTFDIGVRLDTQIGVLRFGFAKLAWLGVTGSTVGR